MLDRGFQHALFRYGLGSVGHAAAAGKVRLWATGIGPDLLDTYTVFGDPALRMVGGPAPARLDSFAASGAAHAVNLDWATTSELDNRLPDYAYVYQWYAKGGANNCYASRNLVYVRCVRDPVRPK